MSNPLPATVNDVSSGHRQTHRHTRRAWLMLALVPMALAACSSLPFADPPRVELVGLQSLPGEGLELRFLAKLRVQNPSSQPLVYEGISVELDLRGQTFASGVAPLAGQVPGYGEAVLEIPISVSGFTIARQMLDLMLQAKGGGGAERVSYALRGKLGGTGLGGTAFGSSGEIDLAALSR